MSLRAYYAVLHILSQIKKKHTKEHLLSNNLQSDPDIDRWTHNTWINYLKIIYAVTQKNKTNDPTFTLINQHDNLHQLSNIIYENIQNSLQENHHYVLYCDYTYPRLLRFIDNYPYGLFVKGNVETLQEPCFSIVGSRKSYPFAIHQSYALGKALAQKGFCIVSGGAFGCDISAHQGTLATDLNPSPIIVVQASGLDQLYPRSNQRIFDSIKDNQGLFLTERLWHSVVKPYDFPIRNRIISGLSNVTIVMDAHLKSGALNTACTALDQGRDVWVLSPANTIGHSQGIENLINDGALSFANTEELLTNYDLDHFFI